MNKKHKNIHYFANTLKINKTYFKKRLGTSNFIC